jgi:hypothetical protein
MSVTGEYGAVGPFGSPMDDLAFAPSVAPPKVTGPDLERIVDKVVERIEQRVIDELERRGRRHTPGVF